VRRCNSTSMRRHVAEGQVSKIRRRFVPSSASAAASADAARSTVFSVNPPRRRQSVVLQQRAACESGESEANRFGEHGREAIIFRRDDEQGLSDDRPIQKGVLARRASSESRGCSARTAGTGDDRTRSELQQIRNRRRARLSRGSRSSAQAANRAAPRLASGSRRSRTLSGRSSPSAASRAPTAGRRARNTKTSRVSRTSLRRSPGSWRNSGRNIWRSARS